MRPLESRRTCGAVQFIDNHGTSIALETFGTGPRTVVFAHGWISSRRMWYDAIAKLDPARFTAYAFDFRGAGLSDRPAAGHDLAGYASDLRAVLGSIDRPLTLVAHSMGGKIAQYVALQPPPTLRSLILVAPGPARAVHTSERHRALALEAFGSRVKIERFQRAAMTRDVSPETMNRTVEDALLAQREAWFGWYDHGRRSDFAARLGELRLPTLVIGADKDPLAPPARLRHNVVEAIDGALLVVLRGVGHNVPIEAPVELAGAIERFATLD